nr:MAG TPA: hypothetical protein [Caudoviricetes sp.]
MAIEFSVRFSRLLIRPSTSIGGNPDTVLSVSFAFLRGSIGVFLLLLGGIVSTPFPTTQHHLC